MALDLSGLQFRVLICVTAHDRLSLVTGKGQGCRASNERMKEMVSCNYARLCSTLTELVELGLLQREKLGRHTVYRAIYTDDDKLLFGNVSVRPIGCQEGSDGPVIGCHNASPNPENQPKNASQYIPLNGGIDSEESGEDNSSEEAPFPARVLPKMEFADNVGGQMARLERALSVGQVVDRLAWYGYLEDVIGDDNPNNSGRATRLADQLVEEMDLSEYRRWGEEHGWVDGDGVWHAPHPREAA